jgi:hypothetical protein
MHPAFGRAVRTSFLRNYSAGVPTYHELILGEKLRKSVL